MRRMLRVAVGISLVGLIALLVSAIGAYRATQSVPDFYEQAISQPKPIAVAEAAGDKLEQRVFELQNDVRRDGRWEAVFSDEQLNAWFAMDLPEKFPNALPKEIAAPRIKISPEQVQAAAKYKTDKFSAVVSIEADLYLTEQQNEIALRIRNVRAGVLPLPLNQFLEKLTKHAHRSGVSLRWAQQDGDPVALLQIPAQHEDYAHRNVYLDTIELRDGEVFLAGRAERVQGETSTAAVSRPSSFALAASN